MQPYFIVFYFLNIITSLFLEVSLQVLVDYCDLIVLLLVFNNFVDFRLKLFNVRNVVLLFDLVLLQDMVSGGEISLMFIDGLLK